LDESKDYSTPAAPGIILQITNGKNEMVDETITKCRSGVGKLLYLSKWT
jgi:hypothetical protein